MKRQSRTRAAAATSTQTGEVYRASGTGMERRYDRVEPSLRSVLARHGLRRASSERHQEVFGDLPQDGEG